MPKICQLIAIGLSYEAVKWLPAHSAPEGSQAENSDHAADRATSGVARVLGTATRASMNDGILRRAHRILPARYVGVQVADGLRLLGDNRIDQVAD